MSTQGLPASLRSLRGARGWTQERLAAELGVSVRAVRDWEAGRRAPRSPTVTHRLAGLTSAPDVAALAAEGLRRALENHGPDVILSPEWIDRLVSLYRQLLAEVKTGDSSATASSGTEGRASPDGRGAALSGR